MLRFSLDYNQLSNSIKHVDKKVFKLSDVKNKLEKVAFDLFRMKDGDPDELWQIQSADDGDYIVAKYDSDDVKAEAKAKTWDVLISESSGDINIFYKGQPITKVAANKLGIELNDLNMVKRFLPNKLASDKGFSTALLNTLDESTRKEILKLYPELQ